MDRPGKLGRLARGAQSEGPEEERQSGMVKVDGSVRGRCISNVGEDGGCDEDIDVEARRIPRNKSGRRSAVGGRRSAVDWSWFRRPLHPDCACGEFMNGAPSPGGFNHPNSETPPPVSDS